ncbi:MAG: type VI secretion system tip protein VgrG, partial [Burkholderiaceae bacterium]|nr:type VI secretion system tip protein VgrG [Burkholderiaceae bacterium]
MPDTQFEIQSDSPAAPGMMFWRIVGHETFSRPSAYELTVLSTNRRIDANDVLGRAFDVLIDFFDDHGSPHQRHCQGHAVRFMRIGQLGRYFEYRILLRSWFWLLTKRTNSRILQDQPVLDIAAAVFEDSPIKAIQKTQPDGVIDTHEPRPYCVQHQESDYRYLSRLFEDEGIYYWFDAHDAPGTMRLSDTSSVPHTALPATGTLPYAQQDASEARRDSIVRWIAARQLGSGQYASRDVYYEHIKTMLGNDANFAESHELADLEVFEYPGGYRSGEQAQAIRPVRADELESGYQLHWALTHWPDVGVGRTFTFQGDPDGANNGEYLIAACTFVVSHPGYEGLPEQDAPQQPVTAILRDALADDAVNAQRLEAFTRLLDDTPELQTHLRGSSAFVLTVLPAANAFKPPRLTPRVTMPGPQNAIVTGPEGEELHVDHMGRVKVQFHWDRYGKNDQNSTCWIRVSQPWAGKAWGGYFMPRIGQEVLVDFVNGDPDRPIIVGRMYNDDQPIPYGLPTQSGFKTRSTPGGGPG